MTDIILSKDTVKRLARDVRQLIKTPLTTNGIHYCHDNENILKGYALIIGSDDTPYSNGNYLFELNFPSDYPQSPPKVIYHTNDGNVRFNPNLYRNGKVCLSMLNTWRGEQWTPCNTISSILLTTCSILTNNPFLNEPDIKPTHSVIPAYNKILTYSNFTVAIGDVLEKEFYKNKFPTLVKIAEKHFVENYNNIKEKLDKNRNLYDKQYVSMNFYRFDVILDYTMAKNRLEKIFNKLKIEYKNE